VQEECPVEAAIRQVGQGRDGRAEHGARVYLTAKTVAERVRQASSVKLSLGDRRADVSYYRSIFAQTYAMACFWRIWTSGHGIFRKFVLTILTIYSESTRC
jgi:hypothetical protein